MAFVAISGFFINETQVIGIFSPIHLMLVLLLVTLWRAIRQVRRGNVPAHRRAMMLLYWRSLVLTGLFASCGPGGSCVMSSLAVRRRTGG